MFRTARVQLREDKLSERSSLKRHRLQRSKGDEDSLDTAQVPFRIRQASNEGHRVESMVTVSFQGDVLRKHACLGETDPSSGEVGGCGNRPEAGAFWIKQSGKFTVTQPPGSRHPMGMI